MPLRLSHYASIIDRHQHLSTFFYEIVLHPMHVLKKTAHLARGFFPNRVGSGEENFIVLFLRGASVSGIHLWNGMSDLAISCYTLHKGIGLSSVIDSASLHLKEFA